jgi:hypothetical protein
MMEVVFEKLGEPDQPSMRGYVMATPQVGEALVFVRLRDSHRIATSPICQVLRSGNGELCVQTANSWYRILVITTEVKMTFPRPVRSWTPAPA